jgi:hypothetical protein
MSMSQTPNTTIEQMTRTTQIIMGALIAGVTGFLLIFPWADEMAGAARFNSGLKDGPVPWHPLNRPYILILLRSVRSSRLERVRTPCGASR